MIEDVKNKINNMNCLVELHLHLDGALSLDNCKSIARIQNITLPEDDNVLLSKMVAKEGNYDLNDFLTKFEFPLTLLQTKEGIKYAVKNLCDELLMQGIAYAEIRFAPQFHLRKGLTIEEVVTCAIEGSMCSHLKSNLVLCCMRNNNNKEENMETIRVAKKYLNKGVCAIDLAGAESIYPTKDFEYLFTYAKSLDVPYTIHAGEASGADSVKDAINFGTKRIGHGVRSSEDSSVVDLIKEKDITLEVCPSSNIYTSIYTNIKEMPIRYFLQNNVKITINTDDPTICRTSLKKELMLVAEAFNLTYEDIINFELNAINASFASNEVKEEVISLINNQ